MKLGDYRIRELAKNIIEHEDILTNEVTHLALIYDYLDQYFCDVEEFFDFYKEVMNYATNLKYGDLYFFQVLLDSNYDDLKIIIDKIQQTDDLTKSIDEMTANTTELLNFINEKFANTHIKADLLEYAQNLSYYVWRIQVHTNILSKLKNDAGGN